MKYFKYVLAFLVYIVLTLTIGVVILAFNMDNIQQLLQTVNINIFSQISIAHALCALLGLVVVLAILIYVLIRNKEIQILSIALISTSIITGVIAIFINNLELVNNFNLLTKEFSALFVTTIKNMIYQSVFLSIPIFVIGITILSIKIHKLRKIY